MNGDFKDSAAFVQKKKKYQDLVEVHVYTVTSIEIIVQSITK